MSERIEEIRARLQATADGKLDLELFDYHADVSLLLAEVDRLNAEIAAARETSTRAWSELANALDGWGEDT